MLSYDFIMDHQKFSLEVDAEIKLVDLIRSRLSFSLKQSKQLLAENRCRVNGRLERFGATLLGCGDKVELLLPQVPAKKAFSQEILYSDDYFVALNKPAGITAESHSFFAPLIPTHRLDKETTGVWLFAKAKQGASAIEELFRQRAMEKEYLALVDGHPKANSGYIDNFLVKQKSYQGQTVWTVSHSEGLKAITAWHVEKRFAKEYSLIRCLPKTGRMHQIRVHLASIGHPILGDWHYSKKFTAQIQAPRCLLHASSLAFMHPFTKECVSITAPLPEDFLLFLLEEDVSCSPGK
jgi:23S rRNA-/tRNA-specific pseudouridylate synthase